MSNAIRKLERNVVKNNIKKDGRNVKKCFTDEWNKFRENKYVTKDEEGNVIADKTPKNTMKKKQIHFDNVEQYNRFFTWTNSLKATKKEESGAK